MALIDTTTVRIALKPGAPLTYAVTRVAATFLLQDQLRLVHTRRFQMVRFDWDKKRDLCRALAVWNGDWGGRQGPRMVRVSFTARPTAGGWLLTEIRGYAPIAVAGRKRRKALATTEAADRP